VPGLWLENPKKRGVIFMHAVEVNSIVKSYNHRRVVDDISFVIDQGEIFGLIGPNGAGKTTTIRMMMDITKPDSGNVNIFGKSLSEDTKNRIGYLPEERGLYRKLKVVESLIYLASLKGMDSQLAARRADELLARVDMLPHKGKKIEELSRGMGQIIQFLVTIIHEPQLVVLDEPFAGLDPVNTELLKQMVLELRNRGTAIILSTHRMNEVEELCDRVLMIDDGRCVLYGELAEIKSKYRNNSIFLKSEGDLGELEGVIGQRENRGYVELFLDRETSAEKVLQQLMAHGIRIDRFEVSTPSLNEIFLQIVGKGYE
jgi:ABC-2 type transport system ATP-binding protein